MKRKIGREKPFVGIQMVKMKDNFQDIEIFFNMFKEYVKLALGNANNSDIESLWNGEKLNAYRQMHLGGAWREIEACRTCGMPYVQSYNRTWRREDAL